MVQQAVGRVSADERMHLLTDTLPAYALCGAGLIIARVGRQFSLGDPEACQDCRALLSLDSPD